MGYREIVRQYETQTARLLESIADKIKNRMLPIDSKLRELVADEELLNFLKARGASALLYDTSSAPRGSAPTPSVMVNYLGQIELVSSNPPKRIVYKLIPDIRSKESEVRINPSHLEDFPEFVEGDSAFLCVRPGDDGTARTSTGDMLAARYESLHSGNVTAESIEETLKGSLEKIAQKSSG